MTLRQIQLARGLTFCGAIPFVACALARLYGVDDLHVHAITLAYGAVIASFLSGMHWGLFLSQAQLTRTNLLVSSNLLALMAWASLLCQVVYWRYAIQIGCFVALWWIDRQLVAEGVIERWFYQLRKQVTLVVILALVWLAAASHF